MRESEPKQFCQLHASAPDQKTGLNSNRSEENVIKQTNKIDKKDNFAVCRIRRKDVPFLILIRYYSFYCSVHV